MIEKDKIKEWYEIYKQGKSLKELGNILHKDHSTIYYHFKRLGFKRRPNQMSDKLKDFHRYRMLNIKPENHPRWKGGKLNRNIFKHILIAEKVIGKKLIKPHCIHHVNGNHSDNRNINLVICENNNYHKLIHLRKKAFYACGHVNWRRCTYCIKWDNPENLIIYKNNAARHRECQRKHDREKSL